MCIRDSYLSTFASSFEQWDSVQTINFPRGHGILKAYMGLRPQDPDTRAHEAMLVAAYGAEKTEEYLSRGIHHVLVYPCLLYTSPSPRDRQKSRMPSSA